MTFIFTGKNGIVFSLPFERALGVISREQVNVINYIVMCIDDFAERFGMTVKAAFAYLSQYGGIDFLLEHYEIEHTLGLDDAMDDLRLVCSQRGGTV
jgi:hypothetical protein